MTHYASESELWQKWDVTDTNTMTTIRWQDDTKMMTIYTTTGQHFKSSRKYLTLFW